MQLYFAPASYAAGRYGTTDLDTQPGMTPLSLVPEQAKALGISRGALYYAARPVPAADLALMRRIDELHLEYPFAGSRMMQGLLKQEGFSAGRLHVATLMKRMGIAAIYRRPNTSKPEPGHKIYPYLLRNVPILRPNQVWACPSSNHLRPLGVFANGVSGPSAVKVKLRFVDASSGGAGWFCA